MRASGIYAALTGLLVAFQLGLAAGMPWGHLAMGGAFPGVYPPEMRVAAVVAALILAGLAFVVVRAADGRNWARRAVWGVVVLMALGLAMNLISPSAAERALWSPVAAVMLACALRVAWRA